MSKQKQAWLLLLQFKASTAAKKNCKAQKIFQKHAPQDKKKRMTDGLRKEVFYLQKIFSARNEKQKKPRQFGVLKAVVCTFQEKAFSDDGATLYITCRKHFIQYNKHFSDIAIILWDQQPRLWKKKEKETLHFFFCKLAKWKGFLNAIIVKIYVTDSTLPTKLMIQL